MGKLKVLTVFGTRPEAIKLAPVIMELKKHQDRVISKICVTAQHREMLDPFLELFGIKPDYDLNIMKPNQSLFDVTSSALTGLKEVLEAENPDIVLIQGDTTTAFAAALAAFYCKIPIGHVEAGLRTLNKYQPFPEEINRRLISHLADLHFAPTPRAKENLLAEGINPSSIFVTGNTVIDALFLILDRTKEQDPLRDLGLDPTKRLILVTAHRRENFGKRLTNICLAIKEIVRQVPDVEVVYPVHLNPRVRSTVNEYLRGVERVHLIEPLDYIAFVHLMKRAYLILTDSGGIQEEAPSLGKPVLVLRETTERLEAIEARVAELVGTETEKIVEATLQLLEDPKKYREMANAKNPFGDGRAAKRIIRILLSRKTNRQA